MPSVCASLESGGGRRRGPVIILSCDEDRSGCYVVAALGRLVVLVVCNYDSRAAGGNGSACVYRTALLLGRPDNGRPAAHRGLPSRVCVVPAPPACSRVVPLVRLVRRPNADRPTEGNLRSMAGEHQ